jgi:hypothetical protein
LTVQEVPGSIERAAQTPVTYKGGGGGWATDKFKRDQPPNDSRGRFEERGSNSCEETLRRVLEHPWSSREGKEVMLNLTHASSGRDPDGVQQGWPVACKVLSTIIEAADGTPEAATRDLWEQEVRYVAENLPLPPPALENNGNPDYQVVCAQRQKFVSGALQRINLHIHKRRGIRSDDPWPKEHGYMQTGNARDVHGEELYKIRDQVGQGEGLSCVPPTMQGGAGAMTRNQSARGMSGPASDDSEDDEEEQDEEEQCAALTDAVKILLESVESAAEYGTRAIDLFYISQLGQTVGEHARAAREGITEVGAAAADRESRVGPPGVDAELSSIAKQLNDQVDEIDPHQTMGLKKVGMGDTDVAPRLSSGELAKQLEEELSRAMSLSKGAATLGGTKAGADASANEMKEAMEEMAKEREQFLDSEEEKKKRNAC